MSSTRFKAVGKLSLQQAAEKAKVREKYAAKGDLQKLLINRKQISEQLEKVLVNQKINRTQFDYENIKRKLFNEYSSHSFKTATIRAHHLTNFLYNYLINAIQSGVLDIDCLNRPKDKYMFQVSKILLKADLNYLYIYWLTSRDAKLNESLEENHLPKLANQIRYLLISNRVIGYIPPIKFVRDDSKAMLEQLDEYLSTIKSDSINHSNNNNNNNTETSFEQDTNEKESNDVDVLVSNVYGIKHDSILNELSKKSNSDEVCYSQGKDIDESGDLNRLNEKYEKSLKAFKIHNLLKKEKESKNVFMTLALNDYHKQQQAINDIDKIEKSSD